MTAFTCRPLKVLLVASEMTPIVKAGGLADVVGALPIALRRRGHDVRVVIPKYRSVDPERWGGRRILAPMGVWMGTEQLWCAVWEVITPQGVPVYLIEHEGLFGREGLYHDNSMRDYDDNPERFGFLSRAALQLCIELQFSPDVVHANDWQTALVPAYQRIWHWDDPILGRSASLLTLHNVAHQGIYPKHHYDFLGLGWNNFTPDCFETYDQLNMLKGGLDYADVVTAVSPNFAREVTRPHGGFGLAPYLASKGRNLLGIVNGIDVDSWDPANDPHLPARYSHTERAGKKACKRELQRRFGLEQDEHVVLLGTVGRFVDQKGYHLLAEALDGLLQHMHVQLAVLGTGESHLEYVFGTAPARYPGRVGSYIGFSEELAHLIEAGSDLFLMPSLFEPCGLNQMYSQRYGTLPVVHAVGGLVDTVDDYDESTGGGTGFHFQAANAIALHYGIGRAVATWYDRPEHIQGMIQTAMEKDFSWSRSAQQYERAYLQAIDVKSLWDAGRPPA
jgi:starch synthase